MKEIRTILLTTDFSDTSVEAFEPARMLAGKFGAKILVAYVEEDRLPPLVVEYTSVGLGELLEQQRLRAADRLARFAKEHLGDDVDTDLEVCIGRPSVEIVRLAEERDVGLIVMATHGRGVITHAFLGSTTERVLRRAPCPVFVVRSAGKE